jgi:hypothetical protein
MNNVSAINICRGALYDDLPHLSIQVIVFEVSEAITDEFRFIAL